MTKKSWIASGIAAVTVMTLGGGMVMADSGNPGSLAQAIASKFNLKASDVQGVIDQQHQQQQVDRQAAVKEKLDQAVKDGKLTSEQETTLLQKLQAIQQDRSTARAAMQDLRQWLSDNRIDLKGILPMMGGMHGRFGRHGMMGAPMASPTPTSSAS